MTLNTIIKKLIVNNKEQYSILIGSIIFSVMMISGYGLIQFSPTVTDVLVDGGSTMMISLTMFLFTIIGTFAFVIYAHGLFLKYKSKEIGIFISLGIKRENVKKIIVKELKIIILVSTLIGLILSLPLSYLSWSMLTSLVNTTETMYKFGWIGLVIAVLFSIICMLTMIFITGRYINKVDIMKILKATEEIEEVKGNKYILGIIGAILIPAGIILFNLSAISDGLFGKLSFAFLISSLVGLYLVIIQITSIGDIIKKINTKVYYKNLVFFNLVKLKGNQYTKTLFVATILVGVTIFAISFNSAPMIDEFLKALNDPYDFSLSTGFQQNGFDESDIKALGDKYNVGINNFKKFNSLLVSTYDEDYLYRNAEVFVSEGDFNKIANENIDIKEGEFVEFISSKNTSHSWYSENGDVEFLNGSNQETFKLKYKETIAIDNVLSGDRYYNKRFCILDDKEYDKLSKSLDEKFKIESYMFNVSDWTKTEEFSDALFNDIANASDNKWCNNYMSGPTFKLNVEQGVENETSADYEYEQINEETKLMAKRWWNFNPYSKYELVYKSIPEYAIYILLMLYISIIAFISAIMIVGIKILNTMWQDKIVYKNITMLGSKEKQIKSIVSKQVMLIYFTPLILGTIITLFLFKEMLKVIGLTHSKEAFLVTCLMALIVVIIQIIIFFFIRKKAIKECLNFSNN